MKADEDHPTPLRQQSTVASTVILPRTAAVSRSHQSAPPIDMYRWRQLIAESPARTALNDEFTALIALAATARDIVEDGRIDRATLTRLRLCVDAVFGPKREG